MNKKIKYYALIWSILFAVFNVVVFLVRPIIPAYTITYDARFWSVWAFIVFAFIGNLVCAYIALKTDNKTKLFYNIPIIRISYIGLILMVVIGVMCMLIPDFPAWVGIIICLLVLAFTAIAVIKAKAASDAVASVDTKIKTKTFFIKSLTVDAESLMARAASPEAKKACKKVYEAVRYSDPMSDDALAGIEAQITLKFNELSVAVKDGAENIEKLAEELIILIGDRNKKCKLLK